MEMGKLAPQAQAVAVAAVWFRRAEDLTETELTVASNMVPVTLKCPLKMDLPLLAVTKAPERADTGELKSQAAMVALAAVAAAVVAITTVVETAGPAAVAAAAVRPKQRAMVDLAAAVAVVELLGLAALALR